MSDGFQMPEILRDGQQPPQDILLPPRRGRRRFWLWLPWVLTGLLLSASLIAWFMVREPMRELTPASLAAARERWEAAGIDSYDLVLDVVTPGSAAAVQFTVRVRAGRVVEWLRDGEPATGDADSYTVDGLFDVLDRELAMGQEAAGPLASPAGAAFLRVRFDEQFGLPLRFLRVVRGSNRSSEFRIREFIPARGEDL